MGTHDKWTEGLIADINSMYHSRADLAALIQKQTEERKALTNEILSDARDLVERIQRDHKNGAKKLLGSLHQFGSEVRKAAEMWRARATRPTIQRNRPTESAKSQSHHSKKDAK
ncbi:MAG: hypothetical protein Q8P51_06545 [Ignavibacteria bacterium]|nr:hypothetical protein [Ignavibacteria bacterium]